jgi:hypothetical protein
MKNFLIGIGVVATLMLLWFVMMALGLFGRATDTALNVADQTVFNASKHVYTYEEFIREKASYDEYAQQETQAENELAKLTARSVISGTEYDNLVMEKTGARNMKHRIAEKYNAMSQTAYQAPWKQKGLPDKLGD